MGVPIYQSPGSLSLHGVHPHATGVHALPTNVHALPAGLHGLSGNGGIAISAHQQPASMKPVVSGVGGGSAAAAAAAGAGGVLVSVNPNSFHHPHQITGHFLHQQQQHQQLQQQQQHHHPPTLLDTQHQLLLQNKQSMALAQGSHPTHFQQLLSKRQLYAVSIQQ